MVMRLVMEEMVTVVPDPAAVVSDGPAMAI
jgi:hypothetical protein